MKLDEFCVRLIPLKLSSLDQALAVIWFHDQTEEGCSLLAGRLARYIEQSGLGNPNSTRLADQLRKSQYTIESSKGFRLKPTGRTHIAERVSSVLKTVPQVDQSHGYLPKHVWDKTRGYVEATAAQMNGCYEYGFFDGASVLLRRLVETLLIEAYEHLGIEQRIRGQDGNYVMLGGIINDAVVRNGISLGRDSKKFLTALKELGDRSAHNRRYLAGKADLDKVQSGVRAVVDELVHIAELRRSS